MCKILDTKNAMLVYNTTYIVDSDVVRNFKIWMNECYIPEVLKSGRLSSPRMLRVLSHREEGSEAYSLQWEVEDSGALHAWHTARGASLNNELLKIFKDKVVGIPTLLEVVEPDRA